jgi:hypothetical protein
LDYSTNPELGDLQKIVIETAGETLYKIQVAELSIQNCVICVFNKVESLFDNLFSQEEKVRKKTLGQLIREIKIKPDIHPDFESILSFFLENRNIFIHKIFSDPNYGITSYDNCKKVQSFLLTLQEYASDVQILFFGWLIEWARQNKLEKYFPENLKGEALFEQVNQESFSLLLNKLKITQQGK